MIILHYLDMSVMKFAMIISSRQDLFSEMEVYLALIGPNEAALQSLLKK